MGYYFERFGKARRLTNLRIDSVDSVDKGAGIGVDVVLRKRREFEAANPGYPRWEPELLKEQTEMRKADHPFLEHVQNLSDMVAKGEIGVGVAELRGKRAHDSSPMFDAYRKDERGKVLSDHQQWQHFKKHHPVGKAFSEACAHGLRDTPAELEKELGLKNDLDAGHERQRELGSGHHGRNEGEVTKGADGKPVRKTLSSVCIGEINKMAAQLVKRAKAEKGVTITFAKAFEVIVNGTEKGRQLAALEKYNRIQV
jgi:hypothetical protein